MRKLAIAGLLAAAAWSAGCGDASGPEAEIPGALVGEWRADAGCAPPCSFTLTWKQNPQASLDAISLGMALRMEIEAGSRFQFGDVSNMPPAGTVRVVGAQLIVTDAEGVKDTIDYHFEGAALHLGFRREFRVVSFNGDTVRDASTAAGVFVRR
jgi:hypothetical protein